MELEEKLDAVITSYLKAVEAGEPIDQTLWLQRHPDVAGELAEFFDSQRSIERVAAPLRQFRPMLQVPDESGGTKSTAIEAVTLPPSSQASKSPGPATIAHDSEPVVTANPATQPGKSRSFGDYELIDEIARGGMGVVYKARQVSLNRVVALKMIIAGQLASRAEVQRFRTEAEAAAHLDHPNIVPIYEVGDHDGQQYFSMKLIEGESLGEALKRRPAPMGGAEAARLLATVSRAIHHAHQRGVLHRDLKPGNILLDSAGQPHITDFGLAKQVHGDSDLTKSGAIVGTPSYMAPEQARADKVLSTGVDVYSLGAVLYELLTGNAPFRAATALDIILQVLEQEPEPPRRLNPRIDRDLETIALKCLDKDPRKRYGSAEALADDMDRWLRGEPILARPVGSSERLWRWCRRNPRVAALLTALGVVLTVGLVSVTWLWLLADERRTAAELQTQRALALSTALADQNQLLEARGLELKLERDNAEVQRVRARANFQRMRDAAEQMLTAAGMVQVARDPQTERQRRTLLEKSREFYQGMLQEKMTDPEERLDAAMAHQYLAVIHGALGQIDDAIAAHEQAIVLLTQLADEFPKTAVYRQRLAHNNNDLGHRLKQAGRHADGEKAFGRALELQEQLALEFPDESDYLRDLAAHHANLGSAWWAGNRFADARKAYERALAIQTKLVESQPQESVHQDDLAGTYNNLGMLHTAQREFKEAEAAHREALKIRKMLVARHHDAPDYFNNLALSHTNFGNMLLAAGRRQEAAPHFFKAVTMQAKLAADFPSTPRYREDLAAAQHARAELLTELKEWTEAEKQFLDQVTTQEKLAYDYPTHPDYPVQLGGCYCNLGHWLKDHGRREAALPWYDKAARALQAVLDRSPRHARARLYLRNVHWGRADMLGGLGRHQEASASWDRALEHDDGSNRKLFQLQRCLSWARLGEHEKAVAEAGKLAEPPNATANTLYDLACVCALASASAKADAQRADQYAIQAVALLRRAMVRGYTNVAHVKKDADLDALRSRGDFQKLVDELAKRNP